ncbi:hypothetical protein DWY72_15695, partial [Phocaeicola plebeius]
YTLISCRKVNGYASEYVEGNFYGYFTVNKYKSKRANFDLVNIICEYYESIREDVDEWYDKIF